MKSARIAQRATAAIVLGLLSFQAAGCSAEETDSEGSAATTPLYVVSTTSYGQELGSASTLLISTQTLESGTADMRSGIELGGAVRVWPSKTPGTFFATSPERASILKYELAPDGQIKQTKELGLSGPATGITSLASTGGVTIAVSETKAYLFDSVTWKAVVWNPSSMTITGTIDLSMLASDLPGFFSSGPIAPGLQRGDEIVLFTFYTDPQQGRVSGLTRVLFLDTKTDAVRIAETRDCGGVAHAVKNQAGDIVGASDTWAAAAHRLGRGPAPCLVRIRAGEHAFDPGWQGKLSAVAPGATIGGIMPAPDGDFYFRLLDETITAIRPDSTASEVYGAPAWRMVRVSQAFDRAAEPVPSLAPAAGAIVWFQVGDQVYANESAADFSSTKLLNLKAGPSPTPALQIVGVPFAAVKLR